MHFKTLYIKAFGAIAERRMEFAASPGLHLIYGPNEAGKSTMLRAVFGLLYGIEERTQDAHRFQYPELRIGAVLVGRDGEPLAVMRRKARKGSLRAWDPKTGEELSTLIDDGALAAFTSGLDEHLYKAAYGLDHARLVAGGHELREGKGAAGEVLFQAGAGFAGAGQLAKTLEGQADALFRPQASTPSINKLSSELEALQKEAATLALRPADWTEHVKAHSDAKDRREAVNKQQMELRRRVHELEHLSVLLPLVVRLKEHRENAAALRLQPHVSPDIVRPLRTQLDARRTEATTAEEQARQKLARAEDELGALPAPDEVLADGEEIKRLGALVDRYAQDRRRQTDLNAERIEAVKAAMTAAAQIGPGVALADLVARRPDDQLVARVNALAGQVTTRQANLESAVKLLDEADSDLRAERKRLEDLPAAIDLSALEACLLRIDGEGDQELAAAQAGAALKTAQQSVDKLAAALSATVADLLRRNVPTEAQIDEAETEVRSRADATRKLEGDIAALKGDLIPLRNELAAWQQQGMPVSREALLLAREQRDETWRPLKDAALQGTAARADTVVPFEQAMANADKVADDRFLDAERATKADAHRLRIGQISERLEQQQQELLAARQASDAALAHWNRLTADMGEAVTAAAARAWLARYARLGDADEARQVQQTAVTLTEARAAEQRNALAAALQSVGESALAESERIATGVQRARLLSNRINAQNRERAQLIEDIRRLEPRLEQRRKARERADSELLESHELWKASMHGVGLPPDALPAEAQAQLQRWVALDKSMAAKATKDAELEAIEAAVQEFKARAAPIATRFMPAVPLDTAIQALRDRVLKAEDTERCREDIRLTLRDRTMDLQEAQQTLRGLNEQWEALLLEHGCRSVEALIEAENRGEAITQVTRSIQELEDQIRLQGRTVEDAFSLCADANPVDIRTQLEEAKGCQESLDSDLNDAIMAEQEARRAVEEADGSDRAANKAQDAAEVMADLTEQAYEYAALRVASQLMSGVIESYRREHQGPVVSRASEIFATITGGKFKRLMADSDEGREILLAVRRNERRMQFHELSDGRRDQLFLALRIASIEERLAHAEPLPLLVDDAAINFDDQAMTATLRALADLGSRTQVLFFTHHPHAIALAKKDLEPSRFVLHELSDAWEPAS